MGHVPTSRCATYSYYLVIEFNVINVDHFILFHLSHVQVWTNQAHGGRVM